MKNLVKKISDNRNRILTAVAVATLVGVAVVYVRDKRAVNDLILTASDVERINLGKSALIIESHGSELAIVPAWMVTGKK